MQGSAPLGILLAGFFSMCTFWAAICGFCYVEKTIYKKYISPYEYFKSSHQSLQRDERSITHIFWNYLELESIIHCDGLN